MSLIEKIDAKITECKTEADRHYANHRYETSRIYYNMTQAWKEAKELILSEQKEPSFATDINVGAKTIGDKIRESNESLANMLFGVLNGQECDSNCPAYTECYADYAESCKASLIKYLNQPYTETN